MLSLPPVAPAVGVRFQKKAPHLETCRAIFKNVQLQFVSVVFLPLPCPFFAGASDGLPLEHSNFINIRLTFGTLRKMQKTFAWHPTHPYVNILEDIQGVTKGTVPRVPRS